MGQALAGMVAILIMLLFTQPSLAGGDEHRTLRLLLDKGIITQQEYDEAVAEEQGVKQATTITENGLQIKLGGFAEIDFFGDNTRNLS